MLTCSARRRLRGLGVLAVSASLAAATALTVTGLVELTHARSRAAVPAESSVASGRAEPEPSGARERILSSRLFAAGVRPEMPAEPGAPREASSSAEQCDARLRLVGAIAARSSSMAAIREVGEPVQIVRIGGALRDGARVAAVQAARVTLARPDGVACSLALFREAPPGAVDGSRATRPPSDELAGLVRQVGPDEYELSRELVDRTLHGSADLRSGRFVVPHEVGGRVVGVRIYGVRPDGLLGRIGLRNGDVLRAINGYALADPYDALEAYARLTRAPELALSLDRDGQPRTLRYHVR